MPLHSLLFFASQGAIREYWIIDPVKQSVEQYILFGDEQKYFPAKMHLLGMDIESKIITGLKIPVAAVFDKQVNVKTLKSFLNS